MIIFAKARPTPAQIAAGNYQKPRIAWHGLEIAIENPAGSVRSGTKPNGDKWSTKMVHPYGYFCRSEGVDGDEVDVFVGPDANADTVYVVHQRKVGDWAKYDEDKVMVCFASEAAARAAFLANYDDKRFLGPITAMPVDEFVAKVRATYERPAMIKAILFFKAIDKRDTGTVDMFGTHLETHTRKDGVVQSYHVGATHNKPIIFTKPLEHSSLLVNNDPVEQPKRDAKMNLTPEQRNDIARSEALYSKYGRKGEGSRAEFKESARGGQLDHLYAEHLENVKTADAAVKAAKKSKNDAWKDKNLPRLTAAKEAREKAEGAEKRRTLRSAIAAEATRKAAEVELQVRRESANIIFGKYGSISMRQSARTPEAVILAFPYDAATVAAVKTIPGAKYLPDTKEWKIDKGEFKKLNAVLDNEKMRVADRGAVHVESYASKTSRTMPTTGRITEDDPSIWGSALLGHEGERWEDFHAGRSGVSNRTNYDGDVDA